jgi:hypothetical protein
MGPTMSDRATIKKLLSEARIQLRAKRDRVRALELVTAADAMIADIDADTTARADIYAYAASLWLDLGDQQRSEQRIVQAIETEAQVTPARPIILGTHKLFYAKLLYAQQRLADAARQASQGLAIYAQGVAPDYPELARIRADLAPILIAARGESTPTSEHDAETFATAMWNNAVQRQARIAQSALVLGAQLRTGAGDEVRTGVLGNQPVLVTLTTRHAAPYAQLAGELRFAFDGIAPLESIGAAQAPYDDMMIEHRPAGKPATELAQLTVPSLARLGAAIAQVLVQAHAAKAVIDGVQPELIYVGDDGRFTGLVPRGPRFITSAPQPIHGPRSYRVPYVGHEALVLGQLASPATDVFALCASLFALGTGTHPFGDPNNLGQLITRMISDQREPWPAGGALAQLLTRGFAQRPDDRPTAAVLASELALIANRAR